MDAFGSAHTGSAHTGLDIRAVLRQHEQRQQQSIFHDSLTRKNTAPAYRPNSRPSDISFEADVEREAKLRAAHGRRESRG